MPKPAVSAPEELTFLDDDEAFDFDDNLPPLPDALAKQLGLAGLDLDQPRSGRRGAASGGAGSRGGAAGKAKAPAASRKKLAVLDVEDALLPVNAMLAAAMAAVDLGLDGEGGALGEDEDDELIAGLDGLPHDALGLPFGALDDEDDAEFAADPESARGSGQGGAGGALGLQGLPELPGLDGRGGRRRGRGAKAGESDGEEEDEAGDMLDPMASGVPSASELNLDENDEEAGIVGEPDDDDQEFPDSDQEDPDPLHLDLDENELQLDLEDDDSLGAGRRSSQPTAKRRRPLVEEEDEGAELEVEDSSDETQLLSVFEDELSVDVQGNLVDGMGNLWGGATFADASKTIEANALSEEEVARRLRLLLTDNPGWARGQVVEFLNANLDESETLAELNPADGRQEFDSEGLSADGLLDQRARQVIDEFWSEVPEQRTVSVPDQAGVPQDREQIQRTRMSLNAMLQDPACRRQLGPELEARARLLAQELRVTADTLEECGKAGWKFNFCPFLKEARELVRQHAPEAYVSSEDEALIGKPTLPKELRRAYVMPAPPLDSRVRPPPSPEPWGSASQPAWQPGAAQPPASVPTAAPEHARAPQAQAPPAAVARAQRPAPGTERGQAEAEALEDAALSAALSGLALEGEAEEAGAQEPEPEAEPQLRPKRGRKPQPEAAAETLPAQAAPKPAAKRGRAVREEAGAEDEAAAGGPAALRVVELREELSKRGLKTTGLKSALVLRLQAALDQEAAAAPSR